ncbi:hypothetical protein TNCV_4561141 [Trichonephila clavipes]|nr:hypothetical protein TNCV_4561141 [Trichonephila clavipes]
MNETPSERTAELAGRQSDPETSWRRSGTYGGRNRKESIAKRDHRGAGEISKEFEFDKVVSEAIMPHLVECSLNI